MVHCQLGRCTAMAPLISLVARHGVRWVSGPPWRLSDESPAMACTFPVYITTPPSCTHYLTYTPLSQGVWSQATRHHRGKQFPFAGGVWGDKSGGGGYQQQEWAAMAGVGP